MMVLSLSFLNREVYLSGKLSNALGNETFFKWIGASELGY